MKVKLTPSQIAYICKGLKENLDLKLASEIESLDKNGFFLDNNIIDEIRDWAIEKMQKIGFDNNYKLNEDGKVLDEIIDLLYVN